MRRILIGVLMAATAATPLFAQNEENRGDRQEHRQQQQKQGEQPRGQHQGGNRQAQPQQQQAQQPQVQQQVRAQQFQRQQLQQQQVQQQQGRGGDNRGNWQGQRGGDQGRQGFQGRENFQGRQGSQNQEGVRTEQNRNFQGQRDNRGNWQGQRDDRGNGRGNWQGDRGERGRSAWNRGWRNDNRFDWQRYRYTNRRLFSPGPYYSPYRGYGYNRLGIGLILDSLFYSDRYWIDPYYYHLPPAPEGTEWVRYYNDVVLVDMDSGEVLDVINDFFW